MPKRQVQITQHSRDNVTLEGGTGVDIHFHKKGIGDRIREFFGLDQSTLSTLNSTGKASFTTSDEEWDKFNRRSS